MNDLGGMTKRNRLYFVWKDMLYRCLDPNHKRYKDYGGRGIGVYSFWKNEEEGFYAFYLFAKRKGWEPGLTIDRIDNSKGYYPANIRFIPLHEQNWNRRDTIRVNIDGENYTLLELSQKTGLNYNTLKNRYYRGDRGERLIR